MEFRSPLHVRFRLHALGSADRDTISSLSIPRFSKVVTWCFALTKSRQSRPRGGEVRLTELTLSFGTWLTSNVQLSTFPGQATFVELSILTFHGPGYKDLFPMSLLALPRPDCNRDRELVWSSQKEETLVS